MKTIIASLVEDQTEILLRLTAIEGYMDLPAGTLTRTPTGKTLRWTVAKNLNVLDPWLADHRDKFIVRRIYKDLRRLGMPEAALNFSELVGMPVFRGWAREIIGNWARSSPTKAGYFIEYLEDPDRTATSIAEEFGVSVTIVARAIREGTALLRKSFADGDAPEALYEAAEILKGEAA